jgi:hypothetical protein
VSFNTDPRINKTPIEERLVGRNKRLYHLLCKRKFQITTKMPLTCTAEEIYASKILRKQSYAHVHSPSP